MTAQYESKFDLRGRVAVVTGAGGGIGGAIARRFAVAGAEIVATDISEDKLNQLADVVKRAGGRCRTLAADVRDFSLGSRLLGIASSPDFLINAAGWSKLTPLIDGNPIDDKMIFDVNVLALLRLSREFAQAMEVKGSGHIINLSSALARAVYPYTTVYAASKHAVSAICQGLRLEMGAKGIKITELCPGLVGNTDILGNTTDVEVLNSVRTRGYSPITPESVAEAAIFVTSMPSDVEVNMLEIKPIKQA